MFSKAAEIDLQRLVKKLRAAAEERAAIPARSGSAPSPVRKERRRKRHELADEIKSLERQIVSWALTNVPPEEGDEDG